MRTALVKGALGIILPTLLAAGAAAAGELRATIHNVKPHQGKVMVALYDGADRYKANDRRAGQMLESVGTDLTVVFSDLPAGRYGLSVFQDLDGNGQLTANLFGIPTEPYGFSRSAAGSFGPPAFEALAVAVPATDAATTDVALTP